MIFKILFFLAMVTNVTFCSSWTADQCTRILNAVVNPAKMSLVSKKYPQKEADDMGITVFLRDCKNEHQLRYELTCELLRKAPSTFDFSKLTQQMCPESSFIAYVGFLNEQKDIRLKGFIEARYPRGLGDSPCNYFMGYVATYENPRGADYVTAGLYFEVFLSWYEKSKSPLRILFNDHNLAFAYGNYALACQRDIEKNYLVEKYLQKSYALRPTASCAGNLADWYLALKDSINEKKYRDISSMLQQKTGKEESIDGVVAQLQFPNGQLLPITHKQTRDSNDMEQLMGVNRERVRAQAHERIDQDPVFASKYAQNILNMYSKLTSQEFANLDDAIQTLTVEVGFADTWPDLDQKKLAIRRIDERIKVVNFDVEMINDIGKLFLKIESACSLEIKSLKNTVRTLVTAAALNNKPHFLTMGYVSQVEGLAEEIAFYQSKKSKIHDKLVEVAIRLDGQQISINKNHISFLDHVRKNNGKPQANILQALCRIGVVKESELYKYWNDLWEKTWGVEQKERWIAWQAELNQLYADSLDAVPLSSSDGASKVKRVGPSQCNEYKEVSAREEEKEYTFSYDSTGTVAEAFRRSSIPEFQISEELEKSLRLEVISGSGGSMSKMCLLQTNSDGSEIELSFFKPHRQHASIYQVDQKKMMIMLWNLHQLQK